MLKIFANGQGGKHRNTDEAARWRYTTTRVANALQATGAVQDRTLALSYAEDEMARAYRIMRRRLQHEATGGLVLR